MKRAKTSLSDFIKKTTVDNEANLKSVTGGILGDCHCVTTVIVDSDSGVWEKTVCTDIK